MLPQRRCFVKEGVYPKEVSSQKGIQPKEKLITECRKPKPELALN